MRDSMVYIEFVSLLVATLGILSFAFLASVHAAFGSIHLSRPLHVHVILQIIPLIFA